MLYTHIQTDTQPNKASKSNAELEQQAAASVRSSDIGYAGHCNNV